MFVIFVGQESCTLPEKASITYHSIFRHEIIEMVLTIFKENNRPDIQHDFEELSQDLCPHPPHFTYLSFRSNHCPYVSYTLHNMLFGWSPRSPVWLFSLIAILSPLCSALFNVTVDDNNPTITYIPTGDWSFGPACSNCIAKPDPAQAFDGTWHDELFIPADDMTQTVTLSFKGYNQLFRSILHHRHDFVLGSAIYAFCVLAPTSDALDGNTDMTFFIDGQNVGSFTRDTTGQSGYQYNVPVYANPSLPFGDHTFTLQNGRTGGQAALALFDYMIFTCVFNWYV